MRRTCWRFVGLLVLLLYFAGACVQERRAEGQPESQINQVEVTQRPAGEAGGADDGEALITAAKRGDAGQVARILDAGADVNWQTRYGATALTFAAERGHLPVARLLIERGAEVNVTDEFYGATPLTWARQGGHTEVVELLTEHGGQAAWGRTQTARRQEERPEDRRQDSQPPLPAAVPSEGDDPHAADRAVSSPNWPQFRGTAARGVAEGQSPPIEWNVETGENLVWKTHIPGLAHSCPVIWGDRLLVTSAISDDGDDSIRIGQYGNVDFIDDDSEHRFVLYCLDKWTGEILWQQTAATGVPDVKRHLKSTHANPTCATDGRFVVALFPTHGLFCYTMDGQLVWHRELGHLDSGWFYDADYQWGFGSSPIIYGNRLIVQCDIQRESFLAAFDLESGDEVWRVERDEIPSWSTPTVYESADGPILVTNATARIRGYDATTGAKLWYLEGNSEIVVPTPIVAHQLIFVASGYRPIQPIYAISIDARGDITPREAEAAEADADQADTDQADQADADGADTDRAGADQAPTGGSAPLAGSQRVESAAEVDAEPAEPAFTPIRWSSMRYGPYMPTPIVYGDYLYICSNNGIIASFHATTGQMVYRERLGASISMSFTASPIAADGHLYLAAEDGNVVVVKAGGEPEVVATNPTGEPVLSTPAISEGMFFIRSQRHVIAVGQPR